MAASVAYADLSDDDDLEGDEVRLLEPRPVDRPCAGLFELMNGEIRF